MHVPAWCAAYRPAQAVQTRSLVVLDFRSASLPSASQQSDAEQAHVASVLARAYPTTSAEQAREAHTLSQQPEPPPHVMPAPDTAVRAAKTTERLDVLARAFPAAAGPADSLRNPPAQSRGAASSASSSAAPTEPGTAAEQPSVTLSSGHAMPLLGLGTWKSPRGAVARAVRAALDAGYRHIDCAAVYKNEHEVGDAIAEAIKDKVLRRDQLFVTSKLWCGFYAQQGAETLHRR